MPELPEVETARRIVERDLVGRTIARLDLRLPKLIRDSPIPSLDPLIGATVRSARRRAKILQVGFSNDLSLLVHFKLAGQLSVHFPDGRRSGAGHPVPHFEGPYPHKATHLIATFTDGVIAFFSDVRQFGWYRLMPSEDVPAAIEAFGFGPEAFGEQPVSAAELGARLSRRSIPLKVALLDQRVLAGLGNIYVDEALHRAALHPERPANSLSAEELERLAVAIPWSLEMGVRQGGAKILHRRAYPIDGFPEVHAREGEACPVCGATIVKFRVGARGTYICPTCQPVP